MRRGITLKVSVFVGVLVLIISVGFGLLAFYRGAAAVREQVEAALIMQAEEAVQHLESRFQVQLTALEAIAARPEIRSMDWEQQKPVLQSELERLGSFWHWVSSIPRHDLVYDGITANLGDRDYVVQAFAGRSVVSDLLVSRVNGSLVLMYAVPIIDNGRTVGVLVGRRDGTALNDITDRLGFGERGWAVVLDSDGTLFAHPNREYVMDRRNFFTDDTDLAEAGAAIKALGVGNTGVVRYSVDGTRNMVGFAPALSTDWMIGVGALEEDVLGDVYALRTFLTLASAAFLAVGVLGAVLLARQISHPLRQVQSVIEAAASGDLANSTDIGSKDEIGAIANAVNKTLDSMREVLNLIASSVTNLADTSSRLAATAQQVSASVEEVASTTNEFSATLDSMNESAQAMNETVQSVSHQAASGNETITDIVHQMQRLRKHHEIWPAK